MKGYSEALLDGVVKDEQQQKIYETHSPRSEPHATSCARFARFGATRRHISARAHSVSIAQLIEETIEKYEPLLQEKGIHLSLDVDHDLVVDGDPDRIEQVLQNLLDNALRYTPSGGNISLRTVNKHPMCELVISDSGQGMSKQDIERLGERFFRTDRSRSREHGGTGLGIAIVKQIVKLHGGSIRFESEQGKGTTVYIQLPLYDES